MLLNMIFPTNLYLQQLTERMLNKNFVQWIKILIIKDSFFFNIKKGRLKEYTKRKTIKLYHFY